MKSLIEYRKEYKTTIELMKTKYKVQYVANYDQYALHGNFELQGLNWHEFKPLENVDSSTTICSNGSIFVLCIDFAFYHSFRNENVSYLTGFNKCRSPVFFENELYLDENRHVILPLEGTEQAEILSSIYASEKQEKEDWKLFKLLDLNNKPIGQRFEIAKSIYWHFLEVLPPIYCENGFYLSEPLSFDSTGKLTYYKFTKIDKKYFAEINTLN